MAERKVWFYEIRTTKDEKFRPPVDWNKVVLPVIESLEAEKAKHVVRDDEYYGRVVRGSVEQIDMLRMGRVRMHDHPMKYDDGQESDLDLGKRAGLLERTHVAFFTDNVVGLLSGAEGPTPGVVRAYINKMVNPKTKIMFIQLFDPETLQKLQRAASDGFRIGTFKPKQGADLSETTEAAPRLTKIFATAQQQAPEMEVTITVRVPDSKEPPPAHVTAIMNEVKTLAENHLHIFDTANVRVVPAQEETSVQVNLISERLGMAQPVTFTGERNRVVSDESARTALAAAYKAMAPRIKAAIATNQSINRE